jgi:hypothetical protein
VGSDVGGEHHGVVRAGNHAVANSNGTTKRALAVSDAFTADVDGHLHQLGGIDHGQPSVTNKRNK